ncbi:thymidine phosphorylase [Spirochaetia bacterium 38H-sp]|uniref:thymidine phosphorylase n=1 Tax=Rarispira pelagica TaxID=3141764 RepID=A0ABU9UBG3_9SPIR
MSYRVVDIIAKKRDGGGLSPDEIEFLVSSYAKGEVPDYQMSAFLMAVFFRGMADEELAVFTRAMMESGRVLDFSHLGNALVDKHSTGGVGDKVSLVLAPAVAACGAFVPMMSGRALGHTGGTLDKLESIEGYRTALSVSEVERVLRECGFVMFGQSEDMVPADKRMYALRDVTATVESVPLITASIVSKKCAEGARGLVFDVKAGGGAFMTSVDDARRLASSLVAGVRGLGRRGVAVVSDMSQPLGRLVGNWLEVEESVMVLRGAGPQDVRELVCVLGGWMLVLAGLAGDADEGASMLAASLDDGSAYDRFCRNVELQGGDVSWVEERMGRYRAEVCREFRAEHDGVVVSVDARAVGMAGVALGVGRSRVEDSVLPDVGVECVRKRGERVSTGDVVMRVWGRSEEVLDEVTDKLRSAVVVDTEDGDNVTSYDSSSIVIEVIGADKA